jgi:hypothetical protein
MILNCAQLSKLQNFSCDCVVLGFSLLHYLDLNALVMVSIILYPRCLNNDLPEIWADYYILTCTHC